MDRALGVGDLSRIMGDSALHGKMAEWRKAFHMNPELAYEEYRTGKIITDVLKGAGLKPIEGVGKTGIVATLDGKLGDGKTIGIRADMDALPMLELNQFAHRSTVDGKMHACGHDGHTAMLLGAAVALAKSPDFFGKVRFIFQPAEEGAAGAKAMIEDGLFTRFPVEQVYSLHNWPKLKAGEAAVHDGPVMASYSTFSVRIHGKGCHAAMPHQGVDPILTLGHIITAINGIVSRNVDPLESAVISVTKIEGGGSHNIIPETAELKGSVRVFSLDVQDTITERIEEMVERIGSAMNCRTDFELHKIYPATINTENEAITCRRVLEQMPTISKIHTRLAPSMASEDFSYMLEGSPGCYIWLGAGKSDGSPGLHSPHYDFNDDILSIGATYWVGLVKTLLGNGVEG